MSAAASKSQHQQWLAIVMLVGALGLAAAWFFMNYERVEQTHTLPARGEARYNPFFALKVALVDLGYEVEVRPLLSLDRDRIAPGDVVVFGADVRTLAEPQVEKLLAAVDAGARVLVEVPRGLGSDDDEVGDEDYDEDDVEAAVGRDPPLFDALEVYAGVPATCLGWTLAVGDGASPCLPRSLYFFGDEFPEGAWTVPPQAALDGDDAGSEAGADDDGFSDDASADDESADDESAMPAVTAIYLPRGDGAVLVTSSLEALRNDAFRSPAMAAYAGQLLAPLLGDGKVWLIYGADVPPLHVLIVRHGWPILVPAFLALLAWLWARSARLGPVLPAAPPDRRALLEHVRAAGELAFRRGRALALHAALKRRYEARLRRIDPAIAALSGDDRMTALAALTGRTPAELRHALQPTDVGRPQSFHAAIKTLSELLHE